MASLADLQDALVKADAAGDVGSARALTQHIDWLRDPNGGNYQAPTAGQSIDLGKGDSWDAPPSMQLGSTTPGRVLQGAIVDPVIGGAQLIVNAVPKVADMLGAHDYASYVRGKAAEMNSGVADYMREYQSDRAGPSLGDLILQTKNDPGFDFGRLAGSLLSPANRVVPFAGATTLPRVAAMGAAQGAVSGALAPVDDAPDFASAKALQVGAGVGVGAIGGAIADRIAQGVSSLIGRFKGAPAAADIDGMIRQSAQANGVDFNSLPTDVLGRVRAQVAAALDRGQRLDPASALRMAEGDAVLGPQAGLTVGQATRDPQAWANEFNLKSVKDGGNALAVRGAAQKRALVAATNEAGAAAAPGDMASGTQLLAALRGHDATMQGRVADLYDKALSMHGGDIPLDAKAFTQQTSKTLSDNMAELFLPREFRSMLDKIASGDMPLTVSTAEQLKTRLGMADAAAGDGNTRFALATMRRALDEAPLADPKGAGAEVMDALTTARAAAKERFDAIDASPAMGAMLRDTAPDKFFEKYVVNGNARDLAQLRSVLDPTTVAATRAQLVGYLKSKALNGATDEVGSFSQSAYNKALSGIGDDKLANFFSHEDIASLRRIGRVASYIDVQPAGGATANRSGTAAAALDMLTSVVPVLNLNATKDAVRKYATESAVRGSLSGEIPTTPVPDKPVNALLRGLVPSVAGGAAASVADEVPSVTRRKR